uniref:RBR-type E3 ubiquitin transferase n=1 Tax=Arcella intermedia TaxID=1963864 RepID=A0A6B2L3S1_9EUKA
MEFLNINFSDARTLLKHMKWDIDKLFEQFAENLEGICKAAGVDLSSTQTVTGKKGKGECLICFDESDDITTLSCSHGYCKECWKQYLGLQIKELSQKIICPAPNCGRVMDEFIVMKLCGSKSMRSRFNQSLIDSFVNENNLVKWCPTPNCSCAGILHDFTAERNTAIFCRCKKYWCFGCGEEGHEPALCKQMEDWKVKNAGGDEKLNEKFIDSIAKKCPNCKSRIEKNGGCNHMHCQKCHYHFCWLCMGKFGKGPLGDTSGYGNHVCNNYKNADSELENDWERFRWYSERYNSHFRSLGLEKKLLDTSGEINELIKKMQSSTLNQNFYSDALEQLILSRITLLNSYVFGFFRPIEYPDIDKDLFEFRQRELEIHTEMLAKCVESKPHEIYQQRINMVNTHKMIQNSFRALLDVAYHSSK